MTAVKCEMESYLWLFCLLNWVLSLALLITAAVELWLKIDSGSELAEPPGSKVASLKLPMEYVLTLL